MGKDPVLKIVLILVCLLSIFLVWSSFQYMKRMEADFSQQRARFTKDNQDLKDRLDSLQDMVDRKTEALGALEKEKASLSEKISALQEANRKLEKAYGKLQVSHTYLLGEKEMIIKQFDDVREGMLDLAKKITELEQSPAVDRIRDALYKEENAKVKKILEDALRNIELVRAGKPVNLKPIVVVGKESTGAPAQGETQMQEMPAAGTAGKVLLVDEVANLVVIDLGRKDNIRQGSRCAILKDTREVASGEIVSIRYNLSTVYIDDMKGINFVGEVKQGDEVVVTP